MLLVIPPADQMTDFLRSRFLWYDIDMRLVLASQGFTTPDIAAAVAKLADKPLEALNVAVINEAYVAMSARLRPRLTRERAFSHYSIQ